VATASAAKTALDFIKKNRAKIVDFKFIDLPGMWQHTSLPADQVNEETFASGIGFDGSSIRGFQEIQESDMVLRPSPASARVDGFCNIPTVSFICDCFVPVSYTHLRAHETLRHTVCRLLLVKKKVPTNAISYTTILLFNPTVLVNTLPNTTDIGIYILLCNI